MNLPNKLTIFRIILVPIMVAIPFFNIQTELLGISVSYLIMNLIFIIASYTDHLDGKIARKNNLVTTFGKFADPLADKILVLKDGDIIETGNHEQLLKQKGYSVSLATLYRYLDKLVLNNVVRKYTTSHLGKACYQFIDDKCKKHKFRRT